MADASSLQAAERVLADRNAAPQDLQAIAARYPQLWGHVAQHPNAYPGLLEWLRQQGNPEVAQIADARLAQMTAQEHPAPIPVFPTKQPAWDHRDPMNGTGLLDFIESFAPWRPKFTGRARRFEIWWLLAFELALSLFLGIKPPFSGSVCNKHSGSCYLVPPTEMWHRNLIALAVFWVVFITATVGQMIRRLHDANLSGKLLFLFFVPGLGLIVLLVLFALPSNPKGARFDPTGSS
jgi:uncharacterized membrane protein YhaH (DUF805 family)